MRHIAVILVAHLSLAGYLAGCVPTPMSSFDSTPVPWLTDEELAAIPFDPQAVTRLHEWRMSPTGEAWAARLDQGKPQSPLVVGDMSGEYRFLRFLNPGVRFGWSGDGNSLVYVTPALPIEPMDSEGGGPQTRHVLATISPLDGQTRMLVESPDRISLLESPPGPFIAYVTVPELVDISAPSQPSTVHLFDLETGRDVFTVETPIRAGIDLQWSADGTRFAYAGYTPTVKVVERPSGEERVVEGEADLFFWQGNELATLVERSVETAVSYPLSDRKPDPITAPIAIDLFTTFRPSPSGDRLLLQSKFHRDAKFTVYFIPEKVLVNVSDRVREGRYVEWKDNDHLITFPASPPFTPEIHRVEPKREPCPSTTEIRFDFPMRTGGAQNPDWASRVEPPHVGGPYRYDVVLPGPRGTHHGMMTFRAEEDGEYAVLTSLDVPLAVLSGSMYGAEKRGEALPLRRVNDEGYTRHDVSLKAGTYTLEIGPSATGRLVVAIPRARDPKCWY